MNAHFFILSCSQTSRKEDLLYATIEHRSEQTAGHGTNPGRRDSAENDCDYAEVKLPCKTVKKSENSEDCADDYVLMS